MQNKQTLFVYFVYLIYGNLYECDLEYFHTRVEKDLLLGGKKQWRVYH